MHCLLRSESALAAEHARYFHSFAADGILPPVLSGAMRNVKLRAHDGSLIPAELTVTKAMVGGQALIVASIVDLRPVLVLQEVRARAVGELRVESQWMRDHHESAGGRERARPYHSAGDHARHGYSRSGEPPKVHFVSPRCCTSTRTL